MLRLLLPSLALVLASATALPAHAEKLPAPQIELLRANFGQQCHNTASLITPTWLLPNEVELVCGCSDKRTVARLQEADFADASNLSKADTRRINDIGTTSADECLQPLFAKGVARMATRQCVANAASIPGLEAMPEDRVKKICGCAADRYAETADLHDIDQIASPDSMLMKHIGELLKPQLNACRAL